MQILPSTSTSSQSSWDQYQATSSADSLFYDNLMDLFEDDDNNRQRVAAQDESAWMADSPYNTTSEVFSPFVPQAVRLTQAETDRLADALRKEGVSAAAVEAVRDMGKMPGGPTMDMIVNAMQQAITGSSATLSKREQAALESLAYKLGGAEDGEYLADVMASGSAQNIMNNLMAALKNTPDGVTITQEEMNALTRQLNLPDSTRRQLLAMFGSDNDRTLSGSDWHELFGQAKLDVEASTKELYTAFTALEKHGATIIKDATRREELERQTAMREEKSISHMRTLIRDKATEAAPGRDDSVEDHAQQSRAQFDAERSGAAEKGKSSQTQSAEAAVVKRESVARVPVEEQPETTAGNHHRGTDDPRNARAQSQTGQTQDPRAASFSQETKHSGDSSQDRQEGHARQGQAFAAHTNTASPPVYATVTQGVGTINPMPNTQLSNITDIIPSRGLDQITQAAFSASKNGMQRLELALNSGDLGTMTVILTTRNGEVSALIQPERAETTQIINQQVAAIKAHLEGEGIRVEKVEVQTQLTEDNSHKWQGMDQHNNGRDMAERQRQIEQRRLLGHQGAEDVDSLAHDMHNIGHTASYAGPGLHIVA